MKRQPTPGFHEGDEIGTKLNCQKLNNTCGHYESYMRELSSDLQICLNSIIMFKVTMIFLPMIHSVRCDLFSMFKLSI